MSERGVAGEVASGNFSVNVTSLPGSTVGVDGTIDVKCEVDSSQWWLVLYALLIGLPVVLVEVYKEWRPLHRTPTFLEFLLVGLLFALVVASVTSVVAPFVGDEYAGGADLTVFLLGGFTLVQKIGDVGAKWRAARELRRLYDEANTLCRRMGDHPASPPGYRPACRTTVGYDTTSGVLKDIGKPPDATTRHWLLDPKMIPMSARLENYDRVEGCELRYHLAALFLVSMTYCGSLYNLAGMDVRVIANVAMETYKDEDKQPKKQAAGMAGGLLGQEAAARHHGRGFLGGLLGLRMPARLFGAAAEDPPVLASAGPVQVDPQNYHEWLSNSQEVLSFAVYAAGDPNWIRMHEASAIYDHTSVSRFEMDDNTGLLAAAQRPDSKLSMLATVAAGARVDPNAATDKDMFMNAWIGRIEYDVLVLAMELTAMSDCLSCSKSKMPLAATLGRAFFTNQEWQDLQNDYRDVRPVEVKQETWFSWFTIAVFAIPTLLYLAFQIICGYIPIDQGAEMLALILREHLEGQIDATCQVFKKHKPDADPENKILAFKREQYECPYSLYRGLTTWGWSRPLESEKEDRKRRKVKQCNEIEFEAALRVLKVVIVHVGDVFGVNVQDHVSAMEELSKAVGQVHSLMDAGAPAKQQNGDGGADGGGAPRGLGNDPLGMDPDICTALAALAGGSVSGGDIRGALAALAAGNSSSGGPSVRTGDA